MQERGDDSLFVEPPLRGETKTFTRQSSWSDAGSIARRPHWHRPIAENREQGSYFAPIRKLTPKPGRQKPL
jgi:hypothetical protein